jgi:hypothetical protein
MKLIRTGFVALLCVGITIAYNCDYPGHDHSVQGSASQQSFRSANGLQGGQFDSNFGSGVVTSNNNFNSGVHGSGSIQTSSQIHSAGGLQNEVQDNPPYWWMNNQSPFNIEGSLGCGPNVDCKASGAVQINGQPMDLTKNIFINGGYAAGVDKTIVTTVVSQGATGGGSGAFLSNSNKNNEINLSDNPFLNGGASFASQNPSHNTQTTTQTFQSSSNTFGNPLTTLNNEQNKGTGSVNTQTHIHQQHNIPQQQYQQQQNTQFTATGQSNGLAAYGQTVETEHNDLVIGQNNNNNQKPNEFSTIVNHQQPKPDYSGNPFLSSSPNQFSGSASSISGSGSAFDQVNTNNPLFNGIPNPANPSSNFASSTGVITTTGGKTQYQSNTIASGFVGQNDFATQNSNYGSVNVDRGYLPPVDAVPETIKCRTGPSTVCAPKQVCPNGVITDQQAAANRLSNQNQNCKVGTEVCCRVQATTTRPPVRSPPPPPQPTPTIPPVRVTPTQPPSRPPPPPSPPVLPPSPPVFPPTYPVTRPPPPPTPQPPTRPPTPIPTRSPTPPPPPPPAPRPQTVPCGQAKNQKCVSPDLCINGVVSNRAPQSVLYGQGSLVDKCYAPEVCCRLPEIIPQPNVNVPTREYLPQAESRPNPNTYIVPADKDKNRNPVKSGTRPTQPPSFQGQEYVPPNKDNQGAPSNNRPNVLAPTKGGREPNFPNQETAPANEIPTIVLPNNQVDQYVPPPAGCAAALKCVRSEFCTREGVMSKTAVVLTPDQALFRVPVTSCRNAEENFIGSCCRDPDYVDPWPVGQLGFYNAEILGFDDGSYKPNKKNDNSGQYVPQGTYGTCQPVYRDRRSQPRGAGPIDTGFGEIPWQAMVLLDSKRSLLCGGSIIADDAVITSASCVHKHPANDIMIKGGEWRLGVDEEPKTFQIIRVKNVTFEPRWKPNSHDYDVAILHLEDRLKFDTHIQPICIEDPLWPAKEEDEECITTGWGKEVLKIHIQNALMHVINVTSLPQDACETGLGNSYNKNCSFCGSPKADVCLTDDGSGLACNIGNDYYNLRGIYSTENSCGENPGQLGTFSKIDIFWVYAAFNQPGLKGEDYLLQQQALASAPIPNVKRNFRSTNQQPRRVAPRRY